MGFHDAGEWSAGELIGGHPALDFTNTAGGSGKHRDIDRLLSYADLLAWSVVVGLINDAEARALDSKSHDGRASEIMEQVRAFREALHTALSAVQAGDVMPDKARQEVEDSLRESLSNATLVRDGDSLRWQSTRPVTDLNLPFDRIRLAAHDLLISPELARVRNCERCSWLFIDRGRGKRRRWCSMAACGNRAKAARFYARHK